MPSLKDYDLKNIADLPFKVQIVVCCVLCALVIYFGYLWDISYQEKELQAIQNQEGDFKTQYQGIAVNLVNLQNDLSQLPQIRAAIEKQQAKLVKFASLPDLLNEILKVGTTNQLQFDLFSPGAPVKEKYYLRVPITAIATGSYNQIANFFSQIANMPMIVVIGNYQIARPQGKLNEKRLTTQAGYINQLQAQFVLNVYTLPEEVPVTNKTPGTPPTPGANPSPNAPTAGGNNAP